MIQKTGALETWGRVAAENKLLYVVLMMSLAVNIILAIFVGQTRTETILIPPHFDEKISVVGNKANAGYKKSWALFVASLAGNITPKNIDFVIESIGSMLSPGVYNDLTKALYEQAESIRLRSVSIEFQPRDIYYSEHKDIVWVFGDRYVRAPNQKKPIKSTWTYEISVDINGGRPQIKWLDAYKGKPVTRDDQRQREGLTSPGEILEKEATAETNSYKGDESQ